ncbi:RnfH family protein [Rhodoferax antarcticus]|uniref:UPF0125 protein BLL52_3341 n=1 Tax=Rhodoferax antarcticus ANT.BR TaxID=1111071 RepID=A0A1Q8YAV7_9BURK|nr:RnfH family protein [Rhodoferax antarcticus]APW46746.1 RnfH family protein [Rhodoferax antarcticus]MCW2311212.1 putative ubiquitin-RnfH superfamily antitoxin RatB of RatAB toxin-antitoxin module [Rhodoferax antarcticus]OLP05216.1 hypothetical protein BLL52_3341 [Rhodoferax antarcticus ANT.BR]
MQVWVVYALQPRQVEEVALNLVEPSSVMDALRESGLLQRFPEIDASNILVGIWGREASLQQVLREHDRVEVYRPLRVDPKVARRERFVKQGARTTGLFIKKRPGAKPGY